MASGWDPRSPLPDRVPVMCQLALGHLFLRSGLDPFDIWFTADGFAEALVRLARRYRFDGVLVNLPGREPEIRRRIRRIEESAEMRVIRWEDGGRSVVPRDDNVRYFRPDGGFPFPRFQDVDPDDLFYVEPWDSTGVKHPFTWGFEAERRPDSDFFPPHVLDNLRRTIERAGGGLSVHAEVFSPFSQLLELLDYGPGLLALVDDPAKVHACLERLAAGALDLAARKAACGPDAILISSAFAGGGFISREHYREFVLPYERKVIEGVAARFPAVPVYIHTCGRIGDRLDLLLESGTLGIEALDPPPLGTVDLAEAKRLLRGRAFIKGNIDPVNVLLRGDREAVRADARRRIEVGMPGGGYILSSACSAAPATPPENLEVLAEVAEECGKYAGGAGLKS
jgi:uroporphyrinogen-III decarboxylase